MQATVRIGVGMAACFLGASKGIPLPELMALAGLEPADASHPDRHLPVAGVIAVFRRIEEVCPDRALGFDMVEMTPATTLALVEMAARSAPTLFDAALVHARFSSLSSTAARARVVRTSTHCEWVLEHHPDVEALGHPIDVMMGMGARMLHQAGASVERVDLKHRPRGPAERYTDVFRGPVRFEQPVNRLVLTHAAMDRAPVTANPALSHSLLKQLAVLLPEEEEETVALATQVRQHAFHCGYEVSRLARRLGVSPRTLQRRATAEGTTLRTLLERLRMEQAKALLADRSLGVEDVAFLVRYADLRGFTRAFKRAEGTTPAAFRQTLDARH